MTPPQLLLVDDDRLSLASLSRGLRSAGYEVTTADSGEEALVQASRARFDLAILDIRMGALSGIDAARQLRERWALHTIFLTAFSDRALVDQAIGEGALAYALKPVDAPRLVPVIETALARARELDALAELKAQLETALAAGRNTSMAIGLVMARDGLDERQAFNRLRQQARSERRKLEDLCRELVQRHEERIRRDGSTAA